MLPAEGYLASEAAKAEAPQHGVAGSLLKEEGQQGSAGGILKELVGDTRTRSTIDIIDIGSIGSKQGNLHLSNVHKHLVDNA